MNRKLICSLLILVMVFSLISLAGCATEKAGNGDGGGESESQEPSAPSETTKQGKNHVIWGTSGIAGSWYPTVSTIAGLVMKYTDSLITVQSTGGGTENLRLMQQGEIQMLNAEGNVYAYAYAGEKMFDKPMPEMRFVTQLYPIVFQVAVHADSEFKTIADLKGHSFSPGSAGSGDEKCYEEIVAEFGLNKDIMDWRPLAHMERAMAFKDRNLDAMGFETSVPAGALLEACAQNPVRLLDIGGAERDSLMSKYSWYTPWHIPAGVYNGQDTPCETVATTSMVVAHKDVPDQLVYDVVMSIYEHLEDLEGIHAMTPYIGPDIALLGQGDVPMHPGAEKAYKELGILK